MASFIGGANVLRGQMHDGRADVGVARRRRAPRGAPDGAAVQAFVRPHDIRLEQAAEEPRLSVELARIERMTRVGGHVKLSVELAERRARSTVQMAKAESTRSASSKATACMVDLKEAKVFVGDYAI